MPSLEIRFRRYVLLVAILVAVSLPPASAADDDAPVDDSKQVQPALLIYARQKSTRCFSAGFLADVDERTNIDVQRGLTPVRLGDAEELPDHPFAIMSGEGAFTLTPEQRRNLKRYVRGGGFLLASSGCASEPWRSSFRREIARVLPDAKLERLKWSHPVFSTYQKIERLETIDGGNPAPLFGVTIGGRLAIAFSPNGLNATDEAGENCACCCGHEVRNARQAKVNLLVYALTH